MNLLPNDLHARFIRAAVRSGRKMRKTSYHRPLAVAAILIGIASPATRAAGPESASADQTVLPLAQLYRSAGDRDVVVAVSDIVPPAVAGLPKMPMLPGAVSGDFGGESEIVLGRSGGTELLGGIIGIGLLLRYVHRRRLV